MRGVGDKYDENDERVAVINVCVCVCVLLCICVHCCQYLQGLADVSERFPKCGDLCLHGGLSKRQQLRDWPRVKGM